MFKMKEYPSDILPLYSQGYSLARFFIHQGGKPKFVEYVGEGMRTTNWTAATQKFYGFKSLSDLQLTWVEWVRQGSPLLPSGGVPATLLASSQAASATADVAATTAAAPRNMAGTQLASLTQQPRSRVPDGALASWQTTQSQNARVFAQADQNEMPPLPPNYIPSTAQPNQLAGGADYSRVSRPVSEGWYARRRDQAKAAQAAPAANSSDGSPTAGPTAPTTASSAPQTSPAPQNQQARSSPHVIEAQPLNAAANQTAPAAKSGSNVVLEWTRPADQPFVSRSELTGVAVNDSATLLR